MREAAGSPERARWFHLARSGSQSQRAVWFILPARGASHIIMCISCHFISSGAWDLYKQRKTNTLTTEVNYCKRKEKRKKRTKRESSLHLRQEHKADSLQEVTQTHFSHFTSHISLPFLLCFFSLCFVLITWFNQKTAQAFKYTVIHRHSD